MHALGAGAAICPAIEIKGIAGNAAHGKAFQRGHIRFVIALRTVGIEDGGKRSVSIRDQRLSVQADAVIFHPESLRSVAGLFLTGRLGKSYIVADADDCRNSGNHREHPCAKENCFHPFFHVHSSNV